MSGWLLFNANSGIFQLYHDENKLIFNEMIMRSALYYTKMLSWMLIALTHWNKSRSLIDMLPDSDILSWFPINQSFPFLLNAACRAVLTTSRALGQSSARTGAHTYTTTHRNKTVNVYKIKHIYIVLVFNNNNNNISLL
jgi:hypothetical protein